MATFVGLGFPVTTLVTIFNNPDNLTCDLYIAKNPDFSFYSNHLIYKILLIQYHHITIRGQQLVVSVTFFLLYLFDIFKIINKIQLLHFCLMHETERICQNISVSYNVCTNQSTVAQMAEWVHQDRKVPSSNLALDPMRHVS